MSHTRAESRLKCRHSIKGGRAEQNRRRLPTGTPQDIIIIIIGPHLSRGAGGPESGGWGQLAPQQRLRIFCPIGGRGEETPLGIRAVQHCWRRRLTFHSSQYNIVGWRRLTFNSSLDSRRRLHQYNNVGWTRVLDLA